MPKHVDHAAYRVELARRAAPLFSEQGYSGLGMRAIAAELGVSKSALYHYFPTKRDLFLAAMAVALELATAPDGDGVHDRLTRWAEQLRPVFPGEMSLLFDYLRTMTPAEIAEDPAMALALERFEAETARITGPADARRTLALLLGGLLLEHFSGGRWPVDLGS